ncbi:MAG: protein kinase [Pseudomonadota bacterium]
MKLIPGTTIGRYTVEELIGEGGMATVYRVRHNELHASYALKVLSLGSDAIRRRLVQEGRVQARLRHPNILPVTDILDVDGSPGLIMEYVEGPSLEVLLATRRLPLDEADRLARGILSAVAFAHGQGLVHRDLKPANILLADIGGEFLPKVADFGLVKLVGEGNQALHQTRTGIGFGTPAYMAPEQALDAAHVDERADVFSLGAILYELACGRRAFTGPNAVAIVLRVTAGDYTPPEEVAPSLPGRCIEAIKGALQTDRKRRIQDCAALRAIWEGREHYQPPVEARGDATWAGEDGQGSSDAGLADLQGIIRSIAGRDAGSPAPTAAPVASVAHATAVPPAPASGLPPSLQPSTSLPGPQSDPGALVEGAADGTLAESLLMGEDERADSISEALVSAEFSSPATPRPDDPGPPPRLPPLRSAPTLSAEEEVEDDPPPARIGWLPKIALLVGLLGVLGVGVLTVGGALWLSRPGSEPVGEEPADDGGLSAVVEAGPAPADEHGLPVADATMTPAEQSAPIPADQEAASASSVSEPGLAPAALAPAPSESAPPRAEPAPVRAARTGMVSVSGDMESATLIGRRGVRVAPGEVPVGTYDLEVTFAGGKTITRTGLVRVAEGASVSIRCSARLENCR